MTAPNLFTNKRHSASIGILSLIIGLLLCLTPEAFAQQPADPTGKRPGLALQIGHRSFISYVAVSPDGKTGASFGQDGTLKIWDAQTGDLLDTVAYPNGEGFDFGLGTMAFSADGHTIEFFSDRGSYPNLIKIKGGIYQVKTREFRQSPAPPSSFCPDQGELATIAPDGKSAICKRFLDATRVTPSAEFFLWNPQTNQKTLITKENQWFDTPAFQFSPDGGMIAIYSGRGVYGVVFWDVAARQVKRHLENALFGGFSPDGQTIVAQIPEANRCDCPADDKQHLSDEAKHGAVELWDAQLNVRKRKLIGRSFFGFSPDGQMILLKRKLGAQPAHMEIWDAQLSAIKQTLPGDISDFSDRLFSPDGRMMALGSYNDANEIILYDLQGGKIANRLLTGSIPFDGFAFSRDGATLASLSWSGEAKLWDAHTGELKASLKFPKQGSAESAELTLSMMKVAFSADCQMVVSGGQSGAVVMWNFRAGRVTQTFASNSHGITPGFSSAGQKLLHWQSTPPGAPDIPVMVWDLNTLQAHPLPPDDAEKPLEESKPTLSPDGRLSAKLRGDSKSVTLYDARTGKQLRTLDGHTGAISSIIFAPDSRTMATVSGLPAFDGLSKAMLALTAVFAGDKKPELEAELSKLIGDRTIKLWDAQTGQLKQTLQCDGAIHLARFLPDGSAIIATHSKATKTEELMEANSFTLWDAQTGKSVKTVNAEAHASFLLSPDGSLVISSGRENIRALDARAGELKWETSEVEISILDNNAFSPDGKLLVAQTKYEDLNSATKLLDVQTGQVRWSFPEKGLTAFSPDGQTLVSFSAHHASFWDLGTGKLKWSIITPESGLSQPTLLSDGKLVADFGQHYAIELRDARDGRLLVSLLTLPGVGQPNEKGEITPEWIAFTPEGYYSASPGAARYIRWRVGDKLLPAEAYAKDFNRPDLVQKALQMK